ncbi:MAG: toll/interleukin-1 receptor domain-containing protein [Pirellulales bacterium]|nr:toll/interleukin-1 receptor domain-containing protein [Pirellulales bacterium]
MATISAVELLTALEFWEMYPCHLGDCRAAVALIGETDGQVSLLLRDDARSMVPVTFKRFGYSDGRGSVPTLGWQLVLPAPPKKNDLIAGFCQVGMVSGEPNRSAPIIMTPADCHWIQTCKAGQSPGEPKELRIEIHECLLPKLHLDAESMLRLELERRGMDCSCLVVSGGVCRNVCTTLEGLRSCIGPQKVYWPSAAGDLLNALHPADLEAVLQTERILMRLRTQLTSVVKAGESKSPKVTAKRPGIERGEVFISYSHKDKRWFEDLQTHLKPFLRDGSITAWSDQKITIGSKWFSEIQAALARTSVAVLLVTPDFLASDFIQAHELTPILKEAECGRVRIIWIPVVACAFEKTPLKADQAVIDPIKPLAAMNKAKRNEAWVKICQEIEKARNQE